MTDHFRILPLDEERFRGLADATPEELAADGILTLTADANPGFPCRVSLEDAAVGERVFLLNHAHHETPSPYRAAGPIFVRAGAQSAALEPDEIPPVLAHRELSTRGYDRRGMLRDARTCGGSEIRQVLHAMFGNPAIEEIHVHNAKPGCYACRAVRVSGSSDATGSREA